MTANYALNFDGYWREPNVGWMPSISGIYGVYACTYNSYGQTVSLERLSILERPLMFMTGLPITRNGLNGDGSLGTERYCA